MRDPDAASPAPPPALLVAGAFAALALLGAFQDFLSFVPAEGAFGAMRERWPWWRTFLINLKTWAALSPLFLVAIRLVRKHPLDREGWRSALLHHLAAALLLALPVYALSQLGFLALNTALADWRQSLEILGQIQPRQHLGTLFRYPMIYGAFASAAYAWDARRRVQAREMHALDLQRQLAVAQLQMLRMQLNPHFLFNTLNAITALMRRDAPTAERMMLALTEFLRDALQEDARLEVPLSEELAMAKRYLAIEQLRFPGRIALDLDLAPDTEGVLVPAFLLQPLVENAVRHGLAPRARGGRLRIAARLAQGRLELLVEDDGVGPSSRRPGRGGLGLANTRDRLAKRFHGAATFEAGPGPLEGFRVAMTLPSRLPELAP